ncbi:MAG TPA: adenylate/guanylate cyclase domain-containing protein, partial [Anaerolineae bacterium]|nr:adenylate/guanylate cyclase domain-containing protein [Anaerolineae bacterium]
MTSLPTGTVTFLFTDIEGSTKLAQAYPDTWETARERHHAILKCAIEAEHGFAFQIIGDAFCAAFHTANAALRAAVKAQIDLHAEAWSEITIKVRMGIHTGQADVQANGEYRGYLAMSRVQRLMAAGHGGQVLISLATKELVCDELAKDVSLRDMGERQLKDFIRPEHIYQLVIPNLPANFPPLKTLEAYRHNLPAQLNSFIGREKELAEIKQAIHEHRLVTLTGSGGTGKTRLSLQAAADLLDQFPDGVWFVELAALADPVLVPHNAATALGLQLQSGRSIQLALTEYLREKKCLLLFDNCEHLIDACARFTDALLHACPNLKILATSRETFGLAGEVIYRVPSLAVPSLELPTVQALAQSEAVCLFIDRAVAIQPNFAVTNQNAPAVAQICHQLEGIPLAIELAAARVNVLSVEQISERLVHRFSLLTGGSRTALPRQQTLRALIDWSYSLLSPAERVLFKRLSIFAGGWTLEAAESICAGDGIESFEVLDLLQTLAAKSLVIVGEGVERRVRYRLLETIRQFAREELVNSGQINRYRDRHLDWFLA